jgi:signal transduction histidine kinase
MSLRAILTAITAGLGSLALACALAMSIISTEVHDATLALDAAFETVHRAEQLELDLVTFDAIASGRVHNPAERAAALDATSDERLLDVHTRVADLIDPALIDQVDTPVRASLAGRAVIDDALRSLHALIDACEARAAAARRDAAWWNQLGDIVGIACAGVLLVALVSLAVWLRRLFHPVFAIGRAMEEFGKGRHDARAAETGPLELRHIAQRFNAMADALAVQAKSEFAFVAGVAHDLRNPIGTLKMTAARLASEHDPLTPKDSARMLAILTRQADHLERMVNDLLDRARIEAGDLELRVELLDVRDVVRQAVGVRQASTTTHHLDMSLPEDELLLACDSTRIEQVLDNLVSNAIKYSPEGTSVEIAAHKRDDAVILSVTDHGVGIRPDDTSRVFEPFQRVGVLRSAVAGVGLGLSNVRKIVEAHGGDIEVDSELGRGSVFRVRLPSTPAPAP